MNEWMNEWINLYISIDWPVRRAPAAALHMLHRAAAHARCAAIQWLRRVSQCGARAETKRETTEAYARRIGQLTQRATNYTARSNIEPVQIFLHANGQSAPRPGGARDVGRGAGSHTPSTALESFSLYIIYIYRQRTRDALRFDGGGEFYYAVWCESWKKENG